MKDLTGGLLTRDIDLPRRAAVVAVAAVSAVLLLSVAVASLARASGPEGGLLTPRDVIQQVIINPVITETSPYLHADGMTLYYGDGMGGALQEFWLGGDAEGSGLDRVECSAALDDGPYTSDLAGPTNHWQCGSEQDTYDVRSLNSIDGVITATLYTTQAADIELYYYVEDTDVPSSTASSPTYANSLPIMVGWVATDTESGLFQTCLWAKFESQNWHETELCEAGLAGTFEFSPTESADGTYYFQSVATDNVDNVESAPSGSGDSQTLLDTVPPTVTVQSPATTEEFSWLVEWSAEDPDPGSGIDVYDVSYRVDSGLWLIWLDGVDSTSAIFGPHTPVPVRGGHTYSFRVRAYDGAGNHADSAVASTYVEVGPLHIPVLVRNYSPLTNGGFEEGWAGWTHGGELAQTISSVDAHSGTYAARLGDPVYECRGGVPLGRAWAERTFTIPGSGVTKLQIWYRIWSEDQLNADLFDRFEIWLNGNLELRDGNVTGIYGCEEDPQSEGWESIEIEVSDYAGQSVTLRFENWNWADDPYLPTSDFYNTWTYVDDIELLP
jgi:hypothetical protein